MNTEEIELDLDDVWEEIDTYVRLCGGDPEMVTTDHNKLAARKEIEAEIALTYQQHAAKVFSNKLAEHADTEDLTARGELKEALAGLVEAVKCKQDADALMAARLAHAEGLIA